MKRRFHPGWFLVILIPLGIGIYYLPPVHSRLAWRIEFVRTEIQYWINPPEEVVFVPEQGTTTQASTTPVPTFTSTPGPTSIPTATSTPLPVSFMLSGVKYEDQHGMQNGCGPANFSMALTYWGWEGSRAVITAAIKPNDKDKNVMPYELQEYITDNVPGITSLIRYGGDIDLLKRMTTAGFPVVVEKGIYEVDLNGKHSWMGHYAFVTGYDDADQTIIYQDTYQPEPEKNPGPNRRMKYDEFVEGWRAFNYAFVVVYPVERQSEVTALLGPLADEEQANRHALEVATAELQTLSDVGRYYAAFNIGTSHVALFEYTDAAIAYDHAFSLYADLDVNNSVRPYRMMWYQTGPYKAYYYANRFSDVINLADTTLNDTISEPVLEESLYWRGKAYYMAGDTDKAVRDFRAALKTHVNWTPAVQALQDLGLQP